MPYDLLVKLVSSGTFSVALNVLAQILLFNDVVDLAAFLMTLGYE